MSSRLRGRPPPDAPRRPSNKKENLGMGDRRQRKMIDVPANGSLAARQVLWSVNAGPNPARVAADEASSEAESLQFASREDVENLLGEKINVKNRNDYKGKSQQLTEYTKKLRLCVKWYMELEDGYLEEQEKLRNSLHSEEERRKEIEIQMKFQTDELHATIEKLQREYASLEEKFVREESDKLDAIRRYKDERNEKLAIENSYSSLAEEFDRVSEGAKHISDQLKMLQETNKRMQEYNTSLQQYNSSLQVDAAKNGQMISKLQSEKSAAMETLASVKEHANVLKNQLDVLQSSQQDALNKKDELKKEVNCLRNELQQVRGDRDSLLAQVQSLTPEVTSYKEQTTQQSKQLDEMTSKTKALEETCSSQSEQIQLLQHQLAAANDKLKRADLTATEVLSEYVEQQRTLKDLQDRLADAEYQVVEGEKLRKKLHNTILELKGNIRVFCRVRPVLPYYSSNGTDKAVVSYPTSFESVGRGIDLLHNAQKYSFTFDKVFNQEASQEDVYEEISQLVQSALDGYKVCIFAYGQTGSGKTYTMVGDPKDPEKKGLIPRSLEQIFETSQSLECQGWKYNLQASMLEIYNETIRDLLSFRSNNTDTSSPLSKQYAIKHDSNGNTIVTDLVVEDVSSINQVNSLLLQAAQSRSVAMTQSNEQSSRSHFVFILRIIGINENTEQQVEGWLNLIDLAGSERLAKSGSVGDRLKETQSINKSLSALSDVIFAIAKKDEHVPFRNSKLTYLLQPCLGGDSKTLMFVNISPEISSSAESVCSLRFASRVNSCEIGVPRRQTQMRHSDSRLSFG